METIIDERVFDGWSSDIANANKEVLKKRERLEREIMLARRELDKKRILEERLHALDNADETAQPFFDGERININGKLMLFKAYEGFFFLRGFEQRFFGHRDIRTGSLIGEKMGGTHFSVFEKDGEKVLKIYGASDNYGPILGENREALKELLEIAVREIPYLKGAIIEMA